MDKSDKFEFPNSTECIISAEAVPIPLLEENSLPLNSDFEMTSLESDAYRDENRFHKINFPDSLHWH